MNASGGGKEGVEAYIHVLSTDAGCELYYQMPND